MLSLLFYMIPIAIAIALSIFPIMAALMLLLSADPLRRSVPFAIGWASGLFILVALFSYGAGLLPHGRWGHIAPWVHIAELVIGVVMVALGIIAGLKSIRKTTEVRESRITQAMANMGPMRAAAFGLAMNIRPKNLILTVAAGIAIGGSQLHWMELLLVSIIFVLVASSAVVGLVTLYALGQERVRPLLVKIRIFLELHSATLLSALSVLVGIALIIVGALALFS